MVGGVLGLVMEDGFADSLNTVIKDSLKTGATVTNLEDYHIFYNGWPCMMRTKKITEFGGRQRIKSDEIEWLYRSWRQYEVKDEDVHTTSF